MSPNLDLSTPILAKRDRNSPCRSEVVHKYIWPLDETYILTIIEDFTPTDEIEIFEGIEPIEIEMIDILSIFLVVCIGRTPYDHVFICRDSPKYAAYQCRLPSAEISVKKYPISSLEREGDSFEFLFSKYRIDVK